MLGAVDAPEIISVFLGTVTDWATATVTPLESAPMMAATLSTSTSALAASTPCTGLTAVSRLMMTIEPPWIPPARLMWSAASSTELRRGGPNSESEPVKVLRLPTISGASCFIGTCSVRTTSLVTTLSTGTSFTTCRSTMRSTGTSLMTSCMTGSADVPQAIAASANTMTKVTATIRDEWGLSMYSSCCAGPASHSTALQN